MRAIDTSRATALKHRKMCANDERSVVRAWVEERDMDHLYGHGDVTEYTTTDRAELIRMADALREEPRKPTPRSRKR